MNINTEFGLRDVTAEELQDVEGGVNITPFLEAVQAAAATNAATTGAGSHARIMANAHEMKSSLLSNLPR